MQKVIGLDIGSYSIKAVEIINTFKSYEITNFYENVVPFLPQVPLDLMAPICMEQLFKENQLQADRIVTAMPGQYISSRVLNFNFSDYRKIQNAVLAELEDAVPFNMDDMIIDHHILGSSQGKTAALAVMTRKVFLKNFLDLLQRIKIDPKLVDVDSLAFYNLSPYVKFEHGDSYAMVDIGHEKTSMCVVCDGVLRMFRSINLGGRYITDFLARDLETTYHEAQRIKHEVSRVLCADDQGDDLSGKEKVVVERATIAAGTIVKELGRTIYAFKTWDKTPLRKMYISGGTSKFKNFARMLQDQLEVPAEPLRLDRTDLKIRESLNPHMAILPQSVAIGVRAIGQLKRHSQINLRKGEFAYVQSYESLANGVNVVAKVIGVALALLVVSYLLKYFFYSQQISRLQTLYTKEYRTLFPNASVKPNVEFQKFRKDAENKLGTDIVQMRDAVDKFILENSGSASLIALKKLSEAIPKAVKVDVTLYDFKMTSLSEGKLTLTAETDGYAAQSAIIEAFKKIKEFKDVTEKSSGAKPGTNGEIIQFTIQATYLSGASS